MSRAKDKKEKKVLGWRQALEEAKHQIATYKRKIHELDSSVRIMQEQIASGAPWPGQLDVRKSGQQRSV